MTRLPLATSALLLLATAAADGAESNFAGRSVDARADLTIELPWDERLRDHPLRVLIGAADVTSLARIAGPGSLVLETSRLGLPPGESEVVVYLEESANAWTELARLALRVGETAEPQEPGQFEPRVQLTNKSQWAENHSGEAPPPPRASYHDFAQFLGASTRHRRGGLEFATRFNFTGSSVRPEALRFATLGNRAPKLDLADYFVELSYEGWALGLGHLSAGRNPLLANSIASRGVQVRRGGARVDLSVSAVNGRTIVGYDDFLGLEHRDDHHVVTADLGFELLARPGALRLELAWMDARQASLASFDIGEIPDAERSRGIGAVLRVSSPGGRVRGTASLARSEYSNPDDPFLAQGDALVPVEPETKEARDVQLDLALIQGAAWPGTHTSSLTLGLRHQRVDPLYGSLGAFVAADVLRNEAALGLQMGPVFLQGRAAASEDNLDDVPTILKTKTRNYGLDLTLPLANLVRAGESRAAWWPAATLSAARVHQYAANVPPPLQSGFDSASHLPDQLTTTYSGSLGWTSQSLSFNYTLAWSRQDNRQLGRENADFGNVNHAVGLNWQLGERFSIAASLGTAMNADRENALDRYTDSGSLSLNAVLSQHFSLAASYALSRNHDSLEAASDRLRSVNVVLTSNFELPFGTDRRLPLQAFVSFARQDGRARNVVFDLDTSSGGWTLNSGFNVGF